MMKWKYAGALVVVVAACGPMYGAPPEKLPKPKVPVDKTLKDDPKPPPPAKPEYVDLCPVDIHRPPDKAAPNKTTAKQRMQEGDVARDRMEKETDEAEKAKLGKLSVQKYSEALVAHPYHADATLMLAVAYDAFRWKGCALRMLERIAVLREHPTYQADALAAADRVRTNPQWFAGYRDEALKAVVP